MKFLNCLDQNFRICFNNFWVHLWNVAFFILTVNIKIAQTQDLEAFSHLAAYSLSGAKDAIVSGTGDKREIYSTGFITRVWAVLLDDQNDLIVIGERDSTLPAMQLDDVVMAIHTKDKVSSGENPGVSIEPPKLDRYSPTQKVVYYGGIDSTHYGTVCYEADLLLKHLSLGFELTGIEGFTSEWDLALDNDKAGRRIDPWGRSVGRSWFFPLLVRIRQNNKCAAITAMTMQVRTDQDEELEIPEKYLDLDEEALAEILHNTPEAVSVIYARLFTQRFDAIVTRFPVLIQLQNLLGLSGLIASITKEGTIKDIDFWLKEYAVKNVGNPTKVPTLSRSVNGLGYSSSISGGVRGFYVVEDAWTDAVLSRKPQYLRQAALLSRPSAKAVSWIIPYKLGNPQNWTRELLQQAQTQESERLSRLYGNATNILQSKNQTDVRGKAGDLSGSISRFQRPLSTPGWHPSTEGQDLFAFKGSFFCSYGGFTTYSPDGRFSISGSEISIGTPVSLQWVFQNRLDLELTVPLTLRINFEDRFSNLPVRALLGPDFVISYAAGIESPIISNRIQLLSGVKNGRWKLPALILENSVVVPTSNKAFEGFLSGESDTEIPFGSDKWHGSHGLQTMIPTSYKSRLDVFGEFQTDWKSPSVGDRLISGASMTWLIDKETGQFISLHFLTSYIKPEPKSFIIAKPVNESWQSQGQQFLLSWSFPTRSGVNSILLGWYAANRKATGAGGSFIIALDLNGTSLWDARKWF